MLKTYQPGSKFKQKIFPFLNFLEKLTMAKFIKFVFLGNLILGNEDWYSTIYGTRYYPSNPDSDYYDDFDSYCSGAGLKIRDIFIKIMAN